ncbi:MAG: pantoate--beta-alanine ligase, partial [Woeseiaceae bacterium]|nr:pantoate--beta-alanine ligase [Woeseiaceae bacterium]
RMVEDMSLPVDIIAAPTCREDDGLALSSRNQYLTDEERAIAPRLYATLEDMAKVLESGKKDYEELEQSALDKLEQYGFEPEYVSIRRAESLEMPDRDTDQLVILAAARLGRARLIDNVVVDV